MKHHLLPFLALSLLSLAACGQAQVRPIPPPTTADTLPTESEAQLMEDIGEILMAGFRGTSVDEQSTIIRDIQQYHLGNVILFEYDAPSGTRHRNVSSPEQIQRLCHDLQRAANGQLLIGIDQEGGNVARMRVRDGFPSTKTAKASAQQGLDSVHRNAQIVARELAEAGINLNFAPCVDVDINPNCPVIGRMERSFSSNPALVSECAKIWIGTQRSQHIVSCLKHFPGHGSASGDTHAGLVDVTNSWQQTELDPYRQLIASGDIEMVMVAHVINRKLGDNLPASLSPKVVKELLRSEMGFDGVIVTDDLAMGAITRQYGFEEALRMALVAGCDMLCISNNGGYYDPNMVPRAAKAILHYVQQGELSAADIHTSAERIRKLKQQRTK